jgi:acyl carrier protein
LAELLGLPQSAVDSSARFERHGLDSAALVGMTGELADWLGCDVEPAAAYEYPSVDALAAALASRETVQLAYSARRRDDRPGCMA